MEVTIKWNVCRLCLLEEKHSDHSFKALFRNPSWAKRITECCGIEMCEDDGLPEKVCIKCLKALSNALKFRSKCQESDEYLRGFVKKTKSATFEPEKIKSNQTYDPLELVDYLPKSPEAQEQDMEAHEVVDGNDLQSMKETMSKKKIKSNASNSNVKTLRKRSTTSEDDIPLVKRMASSINHVDNRHKSTYHVEFDPTETTNKVASNDGDENSNDLHGTGLAHLKIEDTENYYVVMSNELDDKQEMVLDSEEVDVKLLHLDPKSVETEPEEEFVNEELVHEHVSLFEDEKTQFEYEQDNSTSEQMYSEAEEESKGTKPKERKHLDKQILPKFRKNREKVPESLVCETCGNHFTSRVALKSHLRMHRQTQSHECELCAKRFSTACNLTAHMRTHTGEKPYVCQFCDRRFSDRSTHIKHERIHTNERPFQCTVCSKSFSISTSLRAHELIHTGEKRHRCNPCGKAFKLPHQLKAHLKTQLHKMIIDEENTTPLYSD